jgi:hypothetical protein
MLTDLITKYLDAKEVWEAQFDEDDQKAAVSPEWREYMAHSGALIDFRCTTMLEVRQKAEFILSEENLVDILASCSTELAIRDFLKSMVEPVETGENP